MKHFFCKYHKIEKKILKNGSFPLKYYSISCKNINELIKLDKNIKLNIDLNLNKTIHTCKYFQIKKKKKIVFELGIKNVRELGHIIIKIT